MDTTDTQAASAPSSGTGRRPGIGRGFYALLLCIPLSWYFALTSGQTLAFAVSILAIVPLARIIGFATKEIVLQTNPAFGGLVNATFGNAIELFIAYLALRKGLVELVQASIVGSIVANLLLLTGLSIFCGGVRYKEQRFNSNSVGVSATMLIIAVVGIAIPSVYALTTKAPAARLQVLSDAVAVVMASIYLAGVVFAFFTHKHLFDASDEILATQERPRVSRTVASTILLASTGLVALESEILVQNIEPAVSALGLSQAFVGVVIIAIITNVAEKANAIHFALEDKLDVSLEIGLSSAIQIALFVVPILVLVGHLGGYEFPLVFSVFEIIAVVFAVTIVNHLSADGRCNWLEGAQLMAVYTIIAIAVFFI
jgi:Ca2+:H+ antiporter